MSLSQIQQHAQTIIDIYYSTNDPAQIHTHVQALKALIQEERKKYV